MSGLSGVGGGRPRKPTPLKLLAGTARSDRMNPAEPSGAPAEVPDPPADLSDAERQAWCELKAIVDPMRIATASDLFAFRQMVEDAGMLTTLRRSFIDSGGLPVVVEDTKGGKQLRMRPEVQSIPTYRKLMLLHFSRWGLTPGDKSRVSALADAPKANPLKKFGLNRE